MDGTRSTRTQRNFEEIVGGMSARERVGLYTAEE